MNDTLRIARLVALSHATALLWLAHRKLTTPCSGECPTASDQHLADRIATCLTQIKEIEQ